MAEAAPLVLDSVTHLDAAARGRVALCASHGGTYAAWYAAQRGAAALVLHDAGIGRERAGVAGLDWLSARCIPGACVGHLTARIGDGADMAARGIVSAVNAPAAALGVAEKLHSGHRNLLCSSVRRQALAIWQTVVLVSCIIVTES